MEYIEIIKEYLQKSSFSLKKIQLIKLEEYAKLLIQENQKVNLISRKADIADVWIRHILDSIVPVKEKRFNSESLLDFGSGGGLPGIPLKILFPDIKLYLLDSRLRKMAALKKIVKKLDLQNCFLINSRLEEMGTEWNATFNCIVCRSVKQKLEYKKHLHRLLAEKGFLLLYKSRNLEDVRIYPEFDILDVSHNLLGIRKLIEIKKEMFHMEHQES